MRERKPDKRKVQGAETKRKLYEIADRLFAERDPSEISIEDITDEAGITKGAFYVHFKSKDALIAMLIADHAVRADTDYKRFLETLPDHMPTPEVLLELTKKIADELINTFGCGNMKKVYQILLEKKVGTEAVMGYNRDLYTLFYSVLEKGIRRGELTSSLSLDDLSRHFIMAIRGICYEWCVRYPDFDLSGQLVDHIRLLIEGLQAH
jgi:AcrR family transcriptional regulator